MILLAIQTLVISVVILLLYRARAAIGMAPLYVMLGVLQVLQTLTSTVAVELAPGILISPGSAVLFTLSLCCLLLIYISDGPSEARRLIVAIIIANLVAGLLLISFDYQISAEVGRSLLKLPAAVFSQTADALILGTFLLILDVVFTPILYELSARMTRILFLRMAAALIVVLSVDSALYVAMVFASHAQMASILLHSIAAKAVVATVFCGLAATYLRLFEPDAGATSGDENHIFALLTDHRQRL